MPTRNAVPDAVTVFELSFVDQHAGDARPLQKRLKRVDLHDELVPFVLNKLGNGAS